MTDFVPDRRFRPEPMTGAEAIEWIQAHRYVWYQAPMDMSPRKVYCTSVLKTWKRDANRFSVGVEVNTGCGENLRFRVDNGHLDRAYTICDRNGDCKPIRLIVPNVHGVPEVKAEFTPFWWVCDPCNRSERRFEVTYNASQENPQYFPWYQLATSDDTADDIAVKVEFYKRVIAARNAMDAASTEYRRLTGCGWSATPLGEVYLQPPLIQSFRARAGN